MLKRLIYVAAAVILAAAIAYLITVPGARDDAPPTETAAQDEPASDEDGTQPAGTGTPDQPPPGVNVGEPAEAQPAPPEPAPPEPEVGPLDVAALPFEAQCGLQLSRIAENEVLFASGVSLDPSAGGPAAMEIDGALIPLNRVGFDGEPVGFGQYPRQLYKDETGALSVVVEIAVRQSEFTDRSATARGTITVMKPQRATLALDVSGSVGC